MTSESLSDAERIAEIRAEIRAPRRFAAPFPDHDLPCDGFGWPEGQCSECTGMYPPLATSSPNGFVQDESWLLDQLEAKDREIEHWKEQVKRRHQGYLDTLGGRDAAEQELRKLGDALDLVQDTAHSYELEDGAAAALRMLEWVRDHGRQALADAPIYRSLSQERRDLPAESQ